MRGDRWVVNLLSVKGELIPFALTANALSMLLFTFTSECSMLTGKERGSTSSWLETGNGEDTPVSIGCGGSGGGKRPTERVSVTVSVTTEQMTR